MPDRYQSFRNLVQDRQDKWQSFVGIPYIQSYAIAFKSYEDKLAEQAKSDEARGELFVTAAAMATGSILMATIADASMRLLARRTIVVLAYKNLNRTFFKLLQTASKNEAVTFGLGKVVDQIEDKLKDKVKDIAKTWTRTNTTVVSPLPLVQAEDMSKFLINNRLCAYEVAELIEDAPGMGETVKNACYDLLRAAPICNAPATTSILEKITLAELIELTFYLSAMLDSDRLTDNPPWTARTGSLGPTTSKPIDQLPSAANYPVRKVPLPTMGVTPAHQTVDVSRAGSAVQERTNELAAKLNTRIYNRTWFGFADPDPSEEHGELLRAERLLGRIGDITEPLRLLEARR